MMRKSERFWDECVWTNKAVLLPVAVSPQFPFVKPPQISNRFVVPLSRTQSIMQEDKGSFDLFLQKLEGGNQAEVEHVLDCDANVEQEATEGSKRKKLSDAIKEGDPYRVWKLILGEEFRKVPYLEDLNEVSKSLADREEYKVKLRICEFIWSDIIPKNTGAEDLPSKEERYNLKILSNPLCVSLKWLWGNNPNSNYQHKESEKRRESKFKDVIEAALDDAYLLEKMTSYEDRYSRDKYMKRAKKCEEFAVDIVKQVNGNKELLHKVMDIEGKGALLKETSDDFISSLSLLKMAANKERKMFVASPTSQFVLDEVIYHGSPGWRKRGIVIKTAWCLPQLLLVILTILFYIPLRLIRKNCPCRKFDWHWLRMLYEHPYSKFLNHTLSYMIFLAFIFVSSFEDKFRPSGAGLIWIDWVVIAFVTGLLIQELQEIFRQGPFIYFSKWWNVVDTIIVLAFIVAYSVWFVAWLVYREWRPEKRSFIVADAIYASASVMAYFHLAHFFQVSSTLGPLQLSLYKMLKDVLKFLAIFLLLYIAFVTGVAKIYSYYVASERELRKHGNRNTYYQVSHPFALHTKTFIILFWMLFDGSGEEESISVQDDRFTLITEFGRVFMGAYVICSILVALNMLVAMMNETFLKITQNADVEWKFSRTQMWLEWIDKGSSVPVPFNILYVALRALFWFLCGCRQSLCFICRENDEGNTCCYGGACSREGIPGCNFERCHCCMELETPDNKDRLEAMKTLVREYLKDHYLKKWKECRAATARSASEIRSTVSQGTQTETNP